MRCPPANQTDIIAEESRLHLICLASLNIFPSRGRLGTPRRRVLYPSRRAPRGTSRAKRTSLPKVTSRAKCTSRCEATHHCAQRTFLRSPSRRAPRGISQAPKAVLYRVLGHIASQAYRIRRISRVRSIYRIARSPASAIYRRRAFFSPLFYSFSCGAPLIS